MTPLTDATRQVGEHIKLQAQHFVRERIWRQAQSIQDRVWKQVWDRVWGQVWVPVCLPVRLSARDQVEGDAR